MYSEKKNNLICSVANVSSLIVYWFFFLNGLIEEVIKSDSVSALFIGLLDASYNPY